MVVAMLGVVSIEPVDLVRAEMVHAEMVAAAVEEETMEGVVQEGEVAVAGVQLDCNLLQVLALVVGISEQHQRGNFDQEPSVLSLKTQKGVQEKGLFHLPISLHQHDVFHPDNA